MPNSGGVLQQLASQISCHVLPCVRMLAKCDLSAYFASLWKDLEQRSATDGNQNNSNSSNKVRPFVPTPSNEWSVKLMRQDFYGHRASSALETKFCDVVDGAVSAVVDPLLRAAVALERLSGRPGGQQASSQWQTVISRTVVHHLLEVCKRVAALAEPQRTA